MTTTTTFSVTYEIPVSPERLAQLEDEIARVAESEDAGSRLARLANQMLPEKRTEPARQVTTSGPPGSAVKWICPRCAPSDNEPSPYLVLANWRDGEVMMVRSCPQCGATVNRHDHPMSLDLYRMRTRRTDGVEVQAKTQV